MNRDASVTYDIPIQDFIPTFAMVTKCSKKTYEDCPAEGYLFNDANLWTIELTQSQLGFKQQKVDVVLCTDLISSWTEME